MAAAYLPRAQGGGAARKGQGVNPAQVPELRAGLRGPRAARRDGGSQRRAANPLMRARAGTVIDGEVRIAKALGRGAHHFAIA